MIGPIGPLIGILILQGLLLGFGQAAASAETASNRRAGACRIEQFGAYRALAEISQKTGTPIGVDAVQPEKEATIAFDFPGGTLGDLLNMFISQAPDYQWSEAKGGVIHVSRVGGHVSLLDVVIHYPGADAKNREEIWEDLANRPEVAAWMKEAHCSRREFFQGREFSEHNNRISVAAGSMSIAQLLDEVAVKSGENYWAVLQSSPDEECRVAIILW